MKGSCCLVILRQRLAVPACLLMLGAGTAIGQTEAPEPTAIVPEDVEQPTASGEEAGIELLGTDADRNEPAGAPSAVGEDKPADADTARADPLPLEIPGTAPPLREQIAYCYAGDPKIPPSEEVSISFVLDRAGLLLGIPEHVDSGQESAGKRRIFLDAVVALEDCAPYAVDGVETTYMATFTPMTVASLQATASKPSEDVPANTATARIEEIPFATEEAEAALDLSRSDRREIQNRLRLVAHDPQGADGVFGPNTRTAISAWQTEQGFPISGYLNDPQIVALKAQSETEYQAFKESQPKPKKKKRKAKRVRVCKRGVLGVLYDCRYAWR